MQTWKAVMFTHVCLSISTISPPKNIDGFGRNFHEEVGGFGENAVLEFPPSTPT